MTEILRVLKNFALSFLAGDVIAARTLRMYAAIQLPGLYLNYAEDERRKRRADVLRSVLETRGAAQTQPVAFSAIIVYHTNADVCELAPSTPHWTPDSNLRACHLLPDRISRDERAALKSSLPTSENHAKEVLQISSRYPCLRTSCWLPFSEGRKNKLGPRYRADR